MTNPVLRYITGRGGSGTGGLSAYLSKLAEDYSVLPVSAQFLGRDLQDQINCVRNFTTSRSTHVIANSYGAYLFLLSLIAQPSSPIRVLLLSPVLGRAMDRERMLFSRPPREASLKRAISDMNLGQVEHLEILTGEDDEVCDPNLARSIGQQLNIPVTVLKGQGHMLEQQSVATVIDAFLRIQGGKRDEPKH